MSAVSDTGPLHYLVLIDRVEILASLFERIVVPPAVVRELSDAGTPQVVRLWASALPAWVQEQEPLAPLPLVRRGAGERAAIALAGELGLVLLCDDGPARTDARRAGLQVTGTLGVLQLAHARSLLDIRDALADLERTNFHRGLGLFERVVREAEAMRRDLT